MRERVRHIDWLIAASGFILLAAPVHAQQSQDFRIAAGPLGDALILFGRQAGVSIGMSNPLLGAARTRGVHGRYLPATALRKLLVGTGAAAVFTDAQTIRIVRAIGPAIAPQVRTKAIPAEADPSVTSGDIVVTGSKQATPLDRYAGAVAIIGIGDLTTRTAASGSDAIVARLPMLASTHLGPGRNKLFIRGVADSSFNGPSQATVGQYLGDVRLTYNAPDPDLSLYDIDRVEVLEGPQGTLYGTGGLGGIIRIAPRIPDASGWDGMTSLGETSSHTGGRGSDQAAMINVPLAEDRLAFRAVGYRSLDPGYIDDPSRGLADINRTVTTGGRIAVRFTPSAHRSIVIGGALQNIAADDGSYALSTLPPLTRAAVIDQPFDNDFRLVYVNFAASFAGSELVSNTALVRHDIVTVFDATGAVAAPGPARFEEAIGGVADHARNAPDLA